MPHAPVSQPGGSGTGPYCKRRYSASIDRMEVRTVTDEEWLKWLAAQGVPLVAACPVTHKCDGKPGRVPSDLTGRHLGGWTRSEGQPLDALLHAHQARRVNIGAITGRRLRDGRYLVALDVDGEEGKRQTRELLANTPGLRLTPAYETGGGGWRLVFGAHRQMCITRGDGGHQGIALMASGGFIVLPPSGHVSGGSYAWRTDREPRILDLPLSILRWAKDREGRRPVASSLRPIPAAQMDTTEVLRQLRLHGIPQWVTDKIRRGAGGADRSGADMNIISTLVAKRVPDAVIASIYRNPEFGIGEKYRTHSSPDRYLALTLAAARTSLEKNRTDRGLDR